MGKEDCGMIPVLDALWFTFYLLMFFGLLALIRLVIGPTVPDRVVGLDAMTTITVAAMIVLAAIMEEPIIVDIALVYALLSFVATLYIARYLRRKREGLQ